MASITYHYFIITKKPQYPQYSQHINAGQICYMSDYKLKSQLKISPSPINLRVFIMGSRSQLDYDLEFSSIKELSAKEAELLLALAEDTERLKWFEERDALQTALGLSVGTEVTVEEDGKKLRGTIRYIGGMGELICPPGIKGTFFGIELQVRLQSVGSVKTNKHTHIHTHTHTHTTKAISALSFSMRMDLNFNLISLYFHLQEEDKGVSDGTFKNERYFICPSKRALFVKLSSCRPDSRFQKTEHSTGTPETVLPLSTEQVNQFLLGRMKGIQGHCNSCYMDSALFSLFTCSSVLDSMLFKSTAPQDAPIQKTLLHDIVNPLRRCVLRNICVMQNMLNIHCKVYFSDPEEFLIVIMHHILALDPLLKLSAGGKVQESYCYQIFLDQNHSLVLPTVQQLLEHSFHSAGLKLAEVPSCLILQMPRFGKKFKMFDKIIPSLEVDITDLLSEGTSCMLCGNVAEQECTDCFKDPVFSPTGFKVFCKTCSTQVHSHPQRRSHHLNSLDIPKGYLGRGIPHALTRDKLELFAVLCIETSHYVSFVKHGPNSRDWIFFDSMADRQDGYNIPEVQACPEVGTYLEMSPAELASQVPRDMKGVAKRLFCDAYMYLYQSTSMCLYR
uniref:Ubiquitin carboxyl-terminal hydrolase CYLD n=1 Tax=Stegastes partitus TaxID=144197 RepID=A0A3B4ZU64_9TELE